MVDRLHQSFHDRSKTVFRVRLLQVLSAQAFDHLAEKGNSLGKLGE